MKIVYEHDFKKKIKQKLNLKIQPSYFRLEK